MDREAYESKAYAIKPITQVGDREYTVKIENGEVLNTENLEGYMDPGAPYQIKNVISYIEDFMPEIEKMGDQSFSSIQKRAIAKGMQSIWARAYAKGRRAGLEDGMFAVNHFFDFPMESSSAGDDPMDDIMDNAIDRYQDYFEFPSIFDDEWVAIDKRFPSESIKKFAQEHWMDWTRAIHVIEYLGRAAQSGYHSLERRLRGSSIDDSGKGVKDLFFSIIRISDLLDIEYLEGLQLFRDVCDFHKENVDQRKKDVEDWDLIRDAIVIEHFEAFDRGISIDDIFV